MSANIANVESTNADALIGQAAWVKLIPVDALPLREGRTAIIGKQELAIFRLADRVAVLESRCPHKQGPLADGIVSTVEGKVTVTCPLHAWRICLNSGVVAKPAEQVACVRTFPSKVENGILWVQISE